MGAHTILEFWHYLKKQKSYSFWNWGSFSIFGITSTYYISSQIYDYALGMKWPATKKGEHTVFEFLGLGLVS